MWDYEYFSEGNTQNNPTKGLRDFLNEHKITEWQVVLSDNNHPRTIAIIYKKPLCP